MLHTLFTRVGLPLVAALVLFFGGSGTAKAQTVYPRDGYIEHIKFVRDGVEVKLTSLGLRAGLNRANADELGRRVKWWHSRTFNLSSAINPSKMGFQFWFHCQFYRLGGIPPFTINGYLKRHANPVNVTWAEITH